MSLLEEAKKLNKTSKKNYRLDYLRYLIGDFKSWIYLDGKEEDYANKVIIEIKKYIEYLEKRGY